MSSVPQVSTILGTRMRNASSSRSADTASAEIRVRAKTAAKPTAKNLRTLTCPPLAGKSVAIYPKSRLGSILRHGCRQKPLLQNSQKLRTNVPEADAHAQIGLHVHNRSGSLKKFPFGINLHGKRGILCKGIGHLQETAVQAELADPRGSALVRGLLDYFGGGDERVPGRAASFLSHATLPREGGCGDSIASRRVK